MALVVGTNSYISIADADAFYGDHINFDLWNALTPDQKSRGLVTASQEISIFVVDDCKLPFTPPLANAALGQAASLLALHLIQNTSATAQGSTASNIRRVMAGPTEVEFFRPQAGARFPADIMNILAAADCIGSLSGVGTVGLAFSTGIDGTSSFADPSRFDLFEGLS